MSGSTSPQKLLQCWAHPIRPACLTERYPASDRKANSYLFHRRASPLPPSAKVTSTKLLTEPAQASVSSRPIKSSECMINPASQSPSLWLLWDRAQEQHPTPHTRTHTHTHTRLTFPRFQLHSASLLSLSEPPVTCRSSQVVRETDGLVLSQAWSEPRRMNEAVQRE